tara:strand:+ start:102 stop:584 length:483 start_codon:yes stop_codon:yes gene_type:complete
MKAVNINGIITVYQSVPNVLKTSTGTYLNASALSDEDLLNAGCFDLIIDENYDSRIHNLGEVYWDVENTVFRKDAEDKTWTETVGELQTRRINHFKSIVNSELQKTDWYIIRSVDNGDDVPSIITDERAELRSQSDLCETEINSKTTKKNVMQYDFPNVS